MTTLKNILQLKNYKLTLIYNQIIDSNEIIIKFFIRYNFIFHNLLKIIKKFIIRIVINSIE